MPVSPWMAEDLADRVRDLYADAEQRLLGIVARQIADGLEAPGWAVAKLADVQPLRRAAQGVVDALGTAMSTEVHDVVAEAWNRGARTGLAELGALGDVDAARIAESTPAGRAVDRLAMETIELVTATHRGILRGVEDGYRQVVSEVAATPLLGIDTRRQATQRAMERFADRGLRSFVDKAGRSWQMTSYAEMAVRTAVGRAAVEGQADRLRAAGVDLVRVSTTPRECPLCRKWEGRILSLDGPDGTREIETAHALDDARTVRVRVAGSVEQARRAGLQHPNCRHSLSAFTPGVTAAEVPEPSDGTGYEAGQKQRAIERQIRKYKKRAAAAATPEARQVAEQRVRDWQGRMRDHLAANPELKRLRYREQPGAGNLPGPRRPVPPDAVEAAKIRAGDHRTPAEMSDEQLGAALRHGSLDKRDRAKIEAEAGRRDEQALLDRVRPGGRMADLVEFSDDELARALPMLGDSDVLRVAAELDRRDIDAALPGARRDLIAMSERQLAERARHASGDELAALAAEADRRQLLAELLPGGRLLADLSQVADDRLGWALRYTDPDGAARIAAELDRRYPVDPPPATAGRGVEAQLADRAALDDALRPGSRMDDWSWVDQAPDEHPWDRLPAAERWLAEREWAESGRRSAFSARQVRQMYDEYVYAQWLDAEDWCRGYLLTKRAQLDGIGPMSLFSGPSHVAYARASEELKRYWAEVSPRTTLAEYTEQLTGVRSAAADTARKTGADVRNRF
ncbi:phage minor capsid protein [Kitasatospora sp. NBC_01300]|uniref:phage minor capsid protein n=1 Tax=Kitasatospora sp. NBC_01300 TaxID=2903574 RepID=UPI00352CBD8F|nr:phage minor capsid protein [Kitasatospora sp. NBC_01300]